MTSLELNIHCLLKCSHKTSRRTPAELCSAPGQTNTTQRRNTAAAPDIAKDSSPKPTATHLHATPATKHRRAPHYLPPGPTSSTTQVTHNSRRSPLQDPETTRTAPNNDQGRNYTNTDSDLRRKWRGKDPAPTWSHISLFNAWVLISTATMCVYTQHTLPTEIPSSIPTQSPHSPQQSYILPRYDLHSLTHYTTLLHTPAHKYSPPSRAHSAPSNNRRSLRSHSPTHHISNITQVRKMRAPYQYPRTHNAPENTHNTQCINLPQKRPCRRPLPPHTARSQIPNRTPHPNPTKSHPAAHLSLKTNHTAKSQIPNRTPHPNPTKSHLAAHLSLKTNQPPPTIETTQNQSYPNHTLLTPSKPPPTTSHPNNNDCHKYSYTPQLSYTMHPVPPPAKTNTSPLFTVRQYTHSQIHQELFPKTDGRIHKSTLSETARSTHRHSDPRIPTQITDSHTTHHLVTSLSDPSNRQSTLQKLTTLLTKANRRPQIQHSTNAAPTDISQHRTNADQQRIPHQLLQIPLLHSPILTHSITLSSHSIQTAMAPISDSHTAAQHTRNSTGQMQDGRTKARGTTGSNGAGISHRSHSKAAHQHAGRGGGEEAAASPTGVGTRSRSTGRRRALISDYSDEEDQERTNPTPSQPMVIKEKATPSHDYDIEMQLANVSPEHGGSSLQLSSSHNEYIAVPNQAAISTTRLDITNLADATPTTSHKSPRKVATTDTQSAKRRRNETGRHTTSLGASQPQHEKTKEAIPSIDIVAHMWLGFPIHEAIAIQRGNDIIREHRTPEDFTRIGTPTKEVIEFMTLRRAFPHVPQTCYPHERPDAVPGNHLHFTQLPRLEKVDSTTGLSEGFHVTIRFDFGYKGMSRQDARRGCMERLRQMEIPLGTTYSNPIDIGLNAVTKNWAGFIKIHLQHPQRDGIALLQGHRAFVLEMEDGERTIGKVEKGFELMSKARNLRLYIKGETLRHTHASQVFEEIVRESYYTGRQHEFMGLTKPKFDKNFAFLTLTTEEARDLVINEGLTFNHEKLQVDVTRDRGAGNPSELRISTTLVANNLPQRESQASITKAIKQAFGADNIVGVSFGNNPHSDKQSGWCHVQCLNAAVYTEWLHRSTFILGRRIDFIPHHGSIDGAEPNNTAIRLAQAPAREAIAEKIQAMSNASNSNPTLTEKHLAKTMKELEDKLDEKFGTLTTTINAHTDRRHEGTTATITHHTNNLQALFGTIAHELQQSNLRMQGLVNGLSTATLPPLPHGYNTTAPPLPLQAPPGFHTNPSTLHQGHSSFNE